MAMRKALLSVAVLLLIFSSGLASATYITLWQKHVGTTLTNGSSYTIDYSSNPFQLNDNLYIEATFDSNHGDGSHDSNAHMYIYLNSDTIDIYTSYLEYGDDYAVVVKFNGNQVYYSGDYYSGYQSYTRFSKIIAYMVNSTTMKLEIYDINGNLMDGTPVTLSLSSNTLDKITFTVSTYHTLKIDTVYIKRNSTLLTDLKAYDENTWADITNRIDFSESGNTIRIFDPSNYYIARSYYIGSPTALDAYLVKYTDGHWYTLHAIENASITILKQFDSVYKTVAYVKADATGTASVFLSDGVPYLFRVVDTNGTVSEFTRTTDPNYRDINLNPALLSPIELTTSKLADISYNVEPKTLYINQNNTITISLSSPNGYLQSAEAALKVNGKLVDNATLSGSPTGGTITFNYNANGLNLMDRVWLSLKITSTDNLTASTSVNFLLDYPNDNSNSSLKNTLETAPAILGLGTVGRLVLVTFIALFAIIALGAQSNGAILVLLAIYGLFTYLGWMDWRITFVAFIAGLGMILRREE